MNDTNDPYVWPTIEEFIKDHPALNNQSFRLGWAMARVTMSQLKALQATSKPRTGAKRSKGGAA